MAKEYDLVIVGGGPGGYVAAIRAAQLGFSTAVIEQDSLGGTCLNRGCITSKSFFKSAQVFDTVRHAKQFGVSCDSATVNLNDIVQRTKEVVATLQRGVTSLLIKNGVDVYKCKARLMGASIFSPQIGRAHV